MTPTLKERGETKLSVIPKGHWRNKWRITKEVGIVFDDLTLEPYGAGIIITKRKFVSAELAEQNALECLHREKCAEFADPIYLGPVHFPDPSEQATPAARLSSIVPSRAANVGRAG